MIQLISGVCRVGHKLMRPSSGPFSMSKEAEERMVSLGVAKYVGAVPECVATPSVAPEDDGVGVNQPEAENAAEDEPTAEEPSFAPNALMKMTRSELNALAVGLGIDGGACANKAEVVDLICASGTNAAMPDLTVEEPVE